MAVRISVDDVRAWVENSKLSPEALDVDYLSQIEEEVLARINSVYNVATWLDKPSTPRLIQVIIAKFYTGWLYDKFYSENQNQPSQYAQLVKNNAEMLVQGILTGIITIPGLPPDNPVSPVFYPNDFSSSINPETGFFNPAVGLANSVVPGDTSVGPAKFSMGRVF